MEIPRAEMTYDPVTLELRLGGKTIGFVWTSREDARRLAASWNLTRHALTTTLEAVVASQTGE